MQNPTNWAAYWSAVAASCSAATAIFTYLLNRANAHESVRPAVLVGKWAVKGPSSGEVTQYLVIEEVRNAGRGPAINVFIEVFGLRYSDTLISKFRQFGHSVLFLPEKERQVTKIVIPFYAASLTKGTPEEDVMDIFKLKIKYESIFGVTYALPMHVTIHKTPYAVGGSVEPIEPNISISYEPIQRETRWSTKIKRLIKHIDTSDLIDLAARKFDR